MPLVVAQIFGLHGANASGNGYYECLPSGHTKFYPSHRQRRQRWIDVVLDNLCKPLRSRSINRNPVVDLPRNRPCSGFLTHSDYYNPTVGIRKRGHFFSDSLNEPVARTRRVNIDEL